MLVIPAIDLKGGRCVRLTEGRLETERVYAEDPAAQARAFLAAGADRIHVVDLDGAFAGRPENQAAIAAITAAAGAVPVEVGGGLRDLASVERVLGAGARFAILGTLLVKDPEAFAQICRRFPGQIIAGIDARDGRVAIDGWAVESSEDALAVALRAGNLGAAAIIFTDIARDGTGKGVNAAASDRLARAVGLPVIASGGVSGIDDLVALRGTAVAGVVVGKAIYEGRVDLAEAIRRTR